MWKRLLWALLLVLLTPVATAQAATEAILDVSPLYQANYTNVLFEYRGEEKTVANCGCSVACLAMVRIGIWVIDPFLPITRPARS